MIVFYLKIIFWNVSSPFIFISVLKNFLHDDVISVRRNSTLIGNSIKVIRLGFKKHHLSSSYGWLAWENFVLLLTLYHVQNRVMLKKDFIPLLKSVCLLSFFIWNVYSFYLLFFLKSFSNCVLVYFSSRLIKNTYKYFSRKRKKNLIFSSYALAKIQNIK